LAAAQDQDTEMNLANKISIARIILIPFFILSIVYSRTGLALIFFTLAIISDGVDGFIARTFKQKTRLGTILDPTADKLLLLSAYICLTMMSLNSGRMQLPPYVTIIVISRDAIIVLGSVMIYLVTGDLRISPSVAGKVTTFFQMITIVCVLFQFRFSYLVWNITVILTVISGMDYMIKGSKSFNGNSAILKK